MSVLSTCDGEQLVEVVDSVIGTGNVPDIRVVRQPQTGTVQIQVREPICRERFIIADALATVAEVEIDGHLGWGMRLGADSRATLAAAVADALVASRGLAGSGELTAFLLSASSIANSTELAEWADVSRTIIEFEELD